MLRAVALAGLMGLAGAAASAASIPAECVGGISGAQYSTPTDRYPHGALGDPYEWGTLTVHLRLTEPCRAGAAVLHVRLPEELVFEDVTPLLADLDGDGEPEIVTVESHRAQGARVAVWDRQGATVARVAETPFIGQRNRWLAMAGAADLDGDGAVEIAYVDRPHLAKTLRIWRYRDGRLEHVAYREGLTNHRFGETSISGGIRECGQGPEVILATADWSRLASARLHAGGIALSDLGPWSAAAMERAMACR